MRSLILSALLFAGEVQAATTNLPDPHWTINVIGTTTNLTYTDKDASGNVTLSKTYRGANQFYIFSPDCFKPDGPRYHCNIQVTDHEDLVANDGAVATVDALGVAFSSTLNISGHNYWRHSQLILGGSVTTP